MLSVTLVAESGNLFKLICSGITAVLQKIFMCMHMCQPQRSDPSLLVCEDLAVRQSQEVRWVSTAENRGSFSQAQKLRRLALGRVTRFQQEAMSNLLWLIQY